MSIRWNPYIYAGANPINMIDPAGRFFFLPILAGVAAGAVIGAAMDIGMQMMLEGKSFECLDWGSVAFSAILGGIGGGVGSALAKSTMGRLGKFAIEFAVDVIASTVVDVIRGGDLGDSLIRNLVISLAGSAVGELVGGLAGRVGRLVKGGGEYADEVLEQGVRNADDVAERGAKSADNSIPSACGVNSFSADTTVATSDGDIPIAEIEEGDMVYAYNELTGEIGDYAVTHTINHTDKIIIHLYIDGELIETTPEHPFYTEDGEWVYAADLEVGELILSLDGDYGTVEAVVTIFDANQEMYNLMVEDAHTFFVGDGDWLVHNEDCVNLDDSYQKAYDAANKEHDDMAAGNRPKPDGGGAMGAGAYDTRTGKSYGGVSGDIDSFDEVAEPLKSKLPDPSLNKNNIPAYACAEVAVCNNALKDGANLEDLVIAPVYNDSKRRIPNLCVNCQTWTPDVKAIVPRNFKPR